MKKVIVLAVALMMATPAMAKRTYSGTEAAALRCASAIAVTSETLRKFGKISKSTADGATFYAALIMDRYVGGSEREKKQALKQMINRRGVTGNLDDFGDISRKCRKQFPIK